MILANPKNWFPWVDQVDRPYFITIDKLNRVYAEFTDFDGAHPVTARGSIVKHKTAEQEEERKANWYEQVDKDNLKYFIVVGRYGWYYLEFATGLLYAIHQHKEGTDGKGVGYPIETDAFGLQVFGEVYTGKPRKYKLKHFKTSDVRLMTKKKLKVLRGMNCDPTGRYPPKPDSNIAFNESQTSEVHFGWELTDPMYGRITYEGIVSNRSPEFHIKIIYTPDDNLMYHEKFLDFYLDNKFQVFTIIRFNVNRKREWFKPVFGMLRKGELMTWQDKVV